jgi:hypothetical protein
MSEETKKNYTIRLPEKIASRLEKSATESDITPTTLIQSLIIARFETDSDSAKDRPAAKKPPGDALQPSSSATRDSERRHRQLLFEIGKLRSVVLHSLDHTLSADSVDQIIEASEKAASEYVAELLGAQGVRQ